MDPAQFEGIEADSLGWLDDGSVAITWSGGHASVYGRPYLRSKCPCASCKGTHGAPTTLAEPERPRFSIRTGPKPPSVDVALKIAAVEPVGQYAIRFTWGDDHNTGLYSYRYLRAICPCEICQQIRGESTP